MIPAKKKNLLICPICPQWPHRLCNQAVICQIANLDYYTYRSIRLDRAIQLHGRSTLLDDLRIFPMQTSLLILLHSSDLFLKPIYIIICEIQKTGQKMFDLPLLRSFIFVGVTSGCQAIGKRCFLFNSLSASHISTDDRRITNNFRLPIPVNLLVELVTAMRIKCHHTNRLMRKTFLLLSGPTLISRSRSREEPLLKAGEEDIDGPGTTGDRAGVYGRVSRRTEGCC